MFHLYCYNTKLKKSDYFEINTFKIKLETPPKLIFFLNTDIIANCLYKLGNRNRILENQLKKSGGVALPVQLMSTFGRLVSGHHI